MKLKEIAERLDLSYFGNKNIDILSVKYAKYADENSIAVCNSKEDIAITKAKVCLTLPILLNTDKTLIYTHDIALTVYQLLKFLVRVGVYEDYSKIPKQNLLSENVYAGENVCIGTNTTINPFTVIGKNVQIGNNCYIDNNVFIGSDVVIGNNVYISSGAKIGANGFFNYQGKNVEPFCGVCTVIIGNNVNIGYNTIIQRGVLKNTVIGDYTHLGNLIDVGHDTSIGKNCVVVSQSGFASNVTVGNNVRIFGQVGIANDIIIEDDVIIKAKTVVSKNIKSGKVISGMYGSENSEELKLQARMRKFLKKNYRKE